MATIWLLTTLVCISVIWILWPRTPLLYSHRCWSPVWGDNSIDGCVEALSGKKPFDGIEVDVRWSNNSFWLHHDSARLATHTLKDLLSSLENATFRNYYLYLDFKTTRPGPEFAWQLRNVLDSYKRAQTSVVEVYNSSLVDPLTRVGLKVFGAGGYFTNRLRTDSILQYWFVSLYGKQFLFTASTQCDLDTMERAHPFAVILRRPRDIANYPEWLQCEGDTDWVYIGWFALWLALCTLACLACSSATS